MSENQGRFVHLSNVGMRIQGIQSEILFDRMETFLEKKLHSAEKKLWSFPQLVRKLL